MAIRGTGFGNQIREQIAQTSSNNEVLNPDKIVRILYTKKDFRIISKNISKDSRQNFNFEINDQQLSNSSNLKIKLGCVKETGISPFIFMAIVCKLHEILRLRGGSTGVEIPLTGTEN